MPCNFTLDHYFETLDKYKEAGYLIGPIRSNVKDKVLLLRHDIDFNLDYALALAGQEYYNYDYTATYFILLHAETYNALTTHNMNIIRIIHNMGHKIGLHLDTDNVLVQEQIILEDIIGHEDIEYYSRHNPGLTKKRTCNWLTNANDIPTKYLSDSGRNWREGCFCKWINKVDKLQVLTHPIWWITKTETREQTIAKLWNDLIINIDGTMDDIQIMLKEYMEDLKHEHETLDICAKS